ncbi:hypothetical protein ACSQ67_000288 [Phaseolus vulgaris]
MATCSLSRVIFSFVFLVLLSASSHTMVLGARYLLESTLSKPEVPQLPKPELPKIPELLPKPELPKVPELPKPELSKVLELPKPELPKVSEPPKPSCLKSLNRLNRIV